MQHQRQFRLPSVLRPLCEAQESLAKHYQWTGLKFTLDGRLVGDIAEAIAFENFQLVPTGQRQGGIDAICVSGRSVQVKATCQAGKGPAFSYGRSCADDLLFFEIDLKREIATVLYNGPEAPVRALLPPVPWTHTIRLPQAEIVSLDRDVRPEHRLPTWDAV